MSATIGFETEEQRGARLQSQLLGAGRMDYVPQPPRPSVNEVWHVRFPGDAELYTVKVTEVTPKTIAFTLVGNPLCIRPSQRFEHSDVKFVEKAKP